MSWLAKVIVGGGPDEIVQRSARPAAPAALGTGVRASNGLKEFLELLEGAQCGRLLDLGTARQSTVSFFLDRGFRVSTEDLLRSWGEFRMASVSVNLEPSSATEEISPIARAEGFLRQSLSYPSGEFDAILAWDVFDYLDRDLLPLVVARLHHLMRSGAAILAFFHSRPPEEYHNYRLAEGGIEVTPARPMDLQPRCFQNRELLNLFSQFRSSKTFVGRDQLREALIQK
jgi:hypothetical protein